MDYYFCEFCRYAVYGESLTISKTRLFNYIENFPTKQKQKKLKVYG